MSAMFQSYLSISSAVTDVRVPRAVVTVLDGGARAASVTLSEPGLGQLPLAADQIHALAAVLPANPDADRLVDPWLEGLFSRPSRPLRRK